MKKQTLTNQEVKVEETKVQLTLKELSTKTNLAEGTIRAWIMKPIDGVPYSSENVNYSNLVDKLTKYFPDFEERFGFKAKNVEIVKAERTTKKWLAIDDRIKELVIGTKVTMHNYSLKTELTYCGFMYDTNHYPNPAVLIFSDEKGGYKAYNEEQLSKNNIKLELAE